MNVAFKFEPMQRVTITAYGLHADGRVIRCIKSGHPISIYECEYALNSEIKRGEFYEDELKEILQ